MKTIRYCLYGVLFLFLSLFIIGTFFDYEINDALFHNLDTFGLTVSVIGTVPGYGMFSIIGGGFLAFGLRKEDYPKWGRILFFVGSIICLGVPTYFAGNEFFGPNGFYFVAKQFWGYFIGDGPSTMPTASIAARATFLISSCCSSESLLGSVCPVSTKYGT